MKLTLSIAFITYSNYLYVGFPVNVLLPPQDRSIKSRPSGTFWQSLGAHVAHHPGGAQWTGINEWAAGKHHASCQVGPYLHWGVQWIHPGVPEPLLLMELSSFWVLTASLLSLPQTHYGKLTSQKSSWKDLSIWLTFLMSRFHNE